MKQTTRSILGVLGLLLVVLAVAFGAAWVGRDEEQKAEDKAAYEKLFNFDKNHVVAISIAKPGFLVYLERPDVKSPWMLKHPAPAAADEAAVNLMLSSFNTLKQKKDLGDDHDGKPYGLATSSFIVKVIFDDGKEQGLEFGVESSFDRGIYVRKSGEQMIRIVDSRQKSSFDKSPFDMRNKLLAELPEQAEVTRIDVSANRTPYVLEKVSGAWMVAGAPADSESVDRIATSIKALPIKAVAADDFKLALPGEFGMDPPKIVVKVTARNGQETLVRTIFFSTARAGAVDKQMLSYARLDGQPAILQVDHTFASELDKDPAGFAEKQLVHAGGDSVRRLSFETPSGKVEIDHPQQPTPEGGIPNDLYTVTSPKAGPANKAKLSAALYSLTNLRASAFEGPAPKTAKELAKYGFDKAMTATLLGDGGKVLARVRVGAVNHQRRYVLVDGVDKLALVERKNVEELPWTAADALEIAAK